MTTDTTTIGVDSVVVVGHGRSPEGRGWGDKIDSCGSVIRMWDWNWQNLQDYGCKYDLGLLEAHPSYMLQWRRHNKHEPARSWIASIVNNQPVHAKCLPEPYMLFDQQPWTDVGMEMGGVGSTGRLRFTRGSLAACWAIETLEPPELILVGFDSIRKGYAQPTKEAFSPTYLTSPGTFSFSHYDLQVKENGSTTKHGNHDYAIELPVMEKLAAQHHTKIVWAEDIW